ncbi:MAG: 16S rRNA (cytidine(1402)-2'-O)-methyltransferase [Sphaerospermopsis sp. SIO1G2]|nr:16S rRNA (cytidine(1402)-2'-O)-methyltransferase [Sphaerospermopsis sp. SIO1G2]
MINKSKSSDASSHQNAALGVLYVVATPIGNLADMTFRAVEILQRVSVIACEDTRVSRKLCTHYRIETPLTAYHDHNAQQALPALLARLREGRDVALISDAGTPLISDPGYRLVMQAIAAGITVAPIPGASSVIAAASVAGLPSDRLYFAGFLPTKSHARQTALEAVAGLPATLLYFESGRRLASTLEVMCTILGGQRQAVVAREMTKIYEEIRRDSLAELAMHYGACDAVKGEIVLLVAPPEDESAAIDQRVMLLLDALIPHYPARQAASLVAEVTGQRPNVLYAQILQMKQGRESTA